MKEENLGVLAVTATTINQECVAVLCSSGKSLVKGVVALTFRMLYATGYCSTFPSEAGLSASSCRNKDSVFQVDLKEYVRMTKYLRTSFTSSLK